MPTASTHNEWRQTASSRRTSFDRYFRQRTQGIGGHKAHPTRDFTQSVGWVIDPAIYIAETAKLGAEHPAYEIRIPLITIENEPPAPHFPFAISVTNVGKVHAPPAKPLHWPVEADEVWTKFAPSQVQSSLLQQSPMPRPFWPDEIVPLS